MQKRMHEKNNNLRERIEGFESIQLEIPSQLNIKIKIPNPKKRFMFHFSETINQRTALTITIISMILMLPTFIMHRKYFRTFRHLQLVYLYYLIFGEGQKINLSDSFAHKLSSSWLYFDIGLLSSYTDYVEKTKMLFSTLIVTFVIVLVFFIGSRFKSFVLGSLNWKFILNFFKTIMKIVYLPFMHWSILYMNKQKKPVLPSIVYILLALYPIIQSISYRFLEMTKLDHKMKFTQFFDYLLIEVGVVLLNVGVLWDSKIPAIAYVILWFCFIILYSWNATFAYAAGGRMIYITGELTMIGVFLVVLANPEILNTSSFDMMFLMGIFFADLLYLFAETRYYCINGGPDEEERQVQNKSENSPLKKSQVSSVQTVKIEEQRKTPPELYAEKSDYRFIDAQEETLSRSEAGSLKARRKTLLIEDIPDDFGYESQVTMKREKSSKIIHLDPNIERHVVMRVSERKRPSLSYKRFQWD